MQFYLLKLDFVAQVKEINIHFTASLTTVISKREAFSHCAKVEKPSKEIQKFMVAYRGGWLWICGALAVRRKLALSFDYRHKMFMTRTVVPAT